MIMKRTIVFLSLLLTIISGLSGQSNKPVTVQTSDSLKTAVATRYPVVLFSDTLFYISNRLATMTPKERAGKISGRLVALFDNDTVDISKLHASPNEGYVDVVYGEIIVMSVSPNDALSRNMSQDQLASQYIKAIQTAFVKAHDDRNIFTILKRTALVTLVLAGIWFLILLIRRAHQFIVRKIVSKRDVWLKNLSYKDYTFLTAEQELKVLLWLLQVFKWALIIILVYLLLPLVFSIFPFTRGWASVLFSFVWNPFKSIMISVWDYMPDLFTIVVIYFVFKYLIRFIKYIFTEIETGKLKVSGFHEDWALPTFSMIKILLYAFMFVLIFPHLPGARSEAFQGISVFIGVLLSLGSSSAVGNLIAGLVITYMRPFKVGDRIKIGDVVGDVVEKTLLVTRLRTLKNEEITIPNSSVLSGNTTNYSVMAKSEGLILHTTVTIGYDVPWREVHKALLDAASRTQNLLEEKKPFVLQTSLDDFYVSYQLNVFSRESNFVAPIYSDLHKNIQDAFSEAGIEIMSPHYRAERDGNAVTTPPAEKMKD